MEFIPIHSWAELWALLAPAVRMLAILVIGELVSLYIVHLIKRGLYKTKLDVALVKFLGKAMFIALTLIVILSALNSIGVSTTGLLAALSAAGVAIAVALKDSLSNVAGGILLLLSPRFATGDYIAAGNDEGSVVEVDLLHTTILTADNRQVSIPNGALMNHYITNFSREEKRRVDLTFPIPYSAQVEQAKEIIRAAVLAHPLVLPDPPPFVRVKEYGDSAVNLIVRSWCATENYWTVYFDLLEQVRTALLEKGLDMPYPQMDIHIKTKDPS